jgi:RND family efflux transporter MFP subunit
VVVDVPESESGFSSVGTEADVRFDALPGAPVRAKVSRTSTALDPVARSMRIEIDVPNPDARILPGMFAHVTLGVERRPNVLVVPLRTILRQQDGSYVFVQSGGAAKKHAVKIGTSDGEWCEACSGLTGDESVIVPEGQILADGTLVQNAEAKP